MAKTTTKRKPAKPPAPTEAPKPAVIEVGSEEWRKEVHQARARIERVAELVQKHDEAARRGDTKECAKVRDELADRSARDLRWVIPESEPGSGQYRWDVITVAVLMDLRRRLDTIIDRLPEKEDRA